MLEAAEAAADPEAALADFVLARAKTQAVEARMEIHSKTGGLAPLARALQAALAQAHTRLTMRQLGALPSLQLGSATDEVVGGLVATMTTRDLAKVGFARMTVAETEVS